MHVLSPLRCLSLRLRCAFLAAGSKELYGGDGLMGCTKDLRRLVVRRLVLLFWCIFICWTVYWLIAPLKWVESVSQGGLILRLERAGITLLGPLAFALITAIQGMGVLAVIGQLSWTIMFAIPFAAVIECPDSRVRRIIAILNIVLWLWMGASAARLLVN